MFFLSIYLFDTSLVSSFEHRAARWNYKTTNYLPMKGVMDSIKLWMLRRADYLPTQFPARNGILMAFCSCKCVTLQGCYAVSDSLLSLTFTTWWNSKHLSYVSTQLFCKSLAKNSCRQKCLDKRLKCGISCSFGLQFPHSYFCNHYAFKCNSHAKYEKTQW